METFSGKEIDPLWIKPNDICLRDIARSLSMTCRFGGHVIKFYSVANHCVNMARWFYEQDRFKEAKYALLHEGDEVIYGDIITPVKYLDILEEFREIIKDTQRTIYKQFKLYGNTPKSVKELDELMKVLEARKVKPFSNLAKKEIPSIKIKIPVYSQSRAEKEFISMYEQIETALAK
jgi:5'-deoxynucleotidase YfbR-like HD superfamily hydrolase